MDKHTLHTASTAAIVALGGFLMGFDASVISGVVKFIEIEFDLSKIELGWSVASLAFTATFAMMVAGPLSDRFGRRLVLTHAAILFFISALLSAVAPSFPVLVAARMIGGLGVGAALIVAPMYIAEISPPEIRGRMVSINQLNIVIGISVAFFMNYFILRLGQSNADWVSALQIGEWNWRWMLGVEALPAVLYFFALRFVPESPRWLLMKNRQEEAVGVMSRFASQASIAAQVDEIRTSFERPVRQKSSRLAELFKKPMRLVLVIGISVAILQQITGINAVFFYAPMIFEQSGIGTDAAYMQAVLVGLTNLVCTVLAILLIDRIGRRMLLNAGLAGIAASMFLLAYGFHVASYTLTPKAIEQLPSAIDRDGIARLENRTFSSDLAFKRALAEIVDEKPLVEHQGELINAAIDINPAIILTGILGFVASFAVSIGPVMWVLFSELFPNHIRGVAISFVGLINSGVSFLVQLLFPWELATIGNTGTFLLYGLFAVAGLLMLARILPETKGQSLEQLEHVLTSRE